MLKNPTEFGGDRLNLKKEIHYIFFQMAIQINLEGLTTGDF